MSNNETSWDALARELCFADEKDMLTSLYETKSIAELARVLKCGTATIQRRLALVGIEKRRRGGPNVSSAQRYKMFHVDQRLISFMGLTHAARYLGVSNSALYNYKKAKTGGR